MAASRRKPASDRGRPAIDWEQAFQHYARLPATERSYQAVADEFEVSVRTVEKHGRAGCWRQRLRHLEAEACVLADANLSQMRAAKLGELELLIDATMTVYAHQLRAGTVKVAPADLQRLFKLREDLWAQEAAATSSTRALTTAIEESAQERAARKLEIVRSLHEAGAFKRLQDQLNEGAPA